MTENPKNLLNCRVSIKVHKRNTEVVIGICDAELLGKVLKQGKFRFDISKHFFEGPEISIQEAIPLIDSSPNLNAVGSNIISYLIQRKLVHKDSLVVIENIPVAIKFAL